MRKWQSWGWNSGLSLSIYTILCQLEVKSVFFHGGPMLYVKKGPGSVPAAEGYVLNLLTPLHIFIIIWHVPVCLSFPVIICVSEWFQTNSKQQFCLWRKWVVGRFWACCLPAGRPWTHPIAPGVRICVTFPSLLWSQCFHELWKLLLDKAFLWESRVEFPGTRAFIHLFILVNQREST